MRAVGVVLILLWAGYHYITSDEVGQCEDWSFDCPPTAEPAEPVKVVQPAYAG